MLITSFLIQVNAQTTLTKTIEVDGVTRTYNLYIPATYDGTLSVPLVFNFHGYTSDMVSQAGYGDFRPISDTANFLLIHPQGLDIGGGLGWNNFLNYSPTNYDYAFISQLIDTLEVNYKVDEKRIYSTGMSNGGFMSYDLACFMSNRFAAVASVTGGMVQSHINACNPERRVPIMQIHGTNDLTVLYNGGGSSGSVSVDNLVAHWVNLNECDQSPTIESVPNINMSDFSTVEHQVYSGGINGHEIELYKVIDGGHTWPGSSYDIPGLVTNKDIDASKEIWRFFRNYSLEDQQNAVKQKKVESLIVAPNPVQDEIQMNNATLKAHEVLIIDTKGKVILKQKLTSKINVIKCTSISPGSYYYQLIDKVGGVLKIGKIQKN